MTRDSLERRQVWLYLLAIGGGLVAGIAEPRLGPGFEAALWPVLGLLLTATFVQVPLLHVREAFADGRFLLAVVLGNFVVVPPVVWALVLGLPADAPLRLGVLLVLLVPCTDWFITFTHLGGGATARAIAVTPVNLFAQLVLLPAYLWLLLPAEQLGPVFLAGDLLPAGVLLIGVPLCVAALAERWIEAEAARGVWRERLAWAPVPLLAVVVFLIAGAQVNAVRAAGPLLLAVVPVYAVYLLLAAPFAWVLARALGLDTGAGRALAFSLGTRNSFVVLPFALALPAGWEAAVVVIVVQVLVELFGMVGYLWWVPRRLFVEPAGGGSADTTGARRG